MDQRIDAFAFRLRKILEAALILSLLLCSSLCGLREPVSGQTANARELFAGIELGNEDIKAIAIRITNKKEGAGIKLVNSEIVDLPLELNGTSPAQVAERAAEAVEKLLLQLQQQYQVPPEQIYLIGRSALDAKVREELGSAIKRRAGKTVVFLDQATETQLSIVGIIRKRERVGSTLIDNRSSSILIEVGNYGTKGGYELLRYTPAAQYDFVTMNVAKGTVNFTDDALKAIGVNGDWTALIKHVRITGAASVRKELRAELASKPGIASRKRVFLTGGIVRALATLLYPAERQTFVPLTTKDIADFAAQASRNQQALLRPNLSDISDRKVRQEVEKELADVRNRFTSQQLIVGAELLKIISSELNWQDKKLWFARFGNLGCVLSYVRLQAEK
jgi:hypothetical protein